MMRPLKNLLCLLTISLLFASCGKGGNTNPTTSTSASNANSTGTCQIGQVYTSSQGCLTSDGVYGQGLGNNGQPVAGSCWSGTTMTNYGCQANGNSNFNNVYNGTTGSTGSTSGWTCQPTGTGYVLCCNPSVGCTYQ